MGLDQYAYRKDRKDSEAEFYWRKHAKLQTWMEQLYAEKTGGTAEEFNCVELELTLADIQRLEKDILNDRLPSCEVGFLFGEEWQDETAEDYHNDDLKFCTWAKQVIRNGHTVIYRCWW